MRIVFIGPPGSGKGTQTQRLKDHLGIVHLSTGDVLRLAQREGTPLGRWAAQFMNAGQLVPDDVVLGIVSDRLAHLDIAAGCVFDGFPRTVTQAKALDGILEARGMPLDLVIALEVDEPLLKERLLARGRDDDRAATIEMRFRSHRQLTQPLVEYYRGRELLRPIDGNGSPDEVFVRTMKVIGWAVAKSNFVLRLV